jgi:S1-C subfamily serine protease
MVKKILLVLVVAVVAVNVLGSNGFADNKYSNMEQLGAAIIQLEQKNLAQEQQIKDLLSKTTDEQNTISAIQKNVSSLVRISSDTEIGSGFYVKPNLIMTAYHVVANSSVNVSITLYDGSVITGIVLDHDSKNDIAIIKVDTVGIPVVISTDMHLGQTAISYGYAMGVAATVNQGIISNIGDSIQVSTPINNGDSGGMLLNSSGEVIGIVKSRLESIPNGAEEAKVYSVGYATSAVNMNLFMRRFK